MCSFCIIPFARGRARSREFENLLDEARHLVDHGVKELVLTGVNLGTYRCDNRTLLHVIEVLSTIAGLRRIRISSIEPTTVPREILDWMADPAHPLVPYLHLPLQSGSNRVLRRMRRKYSREEYLDFITVAQDRVHDLCIGTDIMVGFPGETGSDFEDTLELLVNSPLRYAHVFRYSERWGTASTRIPGKIDPVIANRRSVLIRKASAEKRRAYYLHCLGSTVEVLFEHEENGYWTGYTGNYVRVAARSSRCLENEMRQVQLESVCGDLVVGRLGSTADDAA
jgi:threonylcarbamoyladenosine tRNA methylthiotransferase MtaB